jgi:hypothetical protein
MTHSFAQPLHELEQKIIESIPSLVSRYDNPFGRNRPTKPETYKEKSIQRNKFCSLYNLAGRYDNTIPNQFLAPIECLNF